MGVAQESVNPSRKVGPHGGWVVEPPEERKGPSICGESLRSNRKRAVRLSAIGRKVHSPMTVGRTRGRLLGPKAYERNDRGQMLHRPMDAVTKRNTYTCGGGSKRD
jgi:hypothetical protein